MRMYQDERRLDFHGLGLALKQAREFTVQAYHEGAFKTVSKADVLGKGLFRRERAVRCRQVK